jgi:O-antigen/teichoic acid export membrane protein
VSLRRKIMTGVIWAAVLTTGRQAIGLLTFTIMAAILGPRPFGLVAMALVILNLVSIVLNQGLLEGLLQRAEIKANHLDSMFWFVLVTSLLLAACLFFTAEPVARLYGEPALANIQRVLSLVPVAIAAAAVPAALVRRELQFRTFTVRTIVAEVAGGVVGIGLAVAGFGAWAIVCDLLTLHVFSLIVLWAATQWRPSLQFSWHQLRGLLAYGLQVVCIRGLDFVDNQGPRFFIGYGLGAVALGYLHFATSVLRSVNQLFISPLNIVGIPAVARIQNEPEKIERLLFTATRMANLLVYPAFIGIAAIAPVLVQVVFGDKWLPAVPLLQIMTIAGLARIYVDMSSATLRGLGKPQWLLITRAGQALFTVTLALATVRYGVIAVATVLAIKNIVFLPLNIWILQRAGGPRLGPVLAANLPILLAAILMGACVFGWIQFMRDEIAAWALLMTAVVVGVTSYSLSAVILIRSTLRDAFTLLRSIRVSTAPAAGE